MCQCAVRCSECLTSCGYIYIFPPRVSWCSGGSLPPRFTHIFNLVSDLSPMYRPISIRISNGEPDMGCPPPPFSISLVFRPWREKKNTANKPVGPPPFPGEVAPTSTKPVSWVKMKVNIQLGQRVHDASSVHGTYHLLFRHNRQSSQAPCACVGRWWIQIGLSVRHMHRTAQWEDGWGHLFKRRGDDAMTVLGCTKNCHRHWHITSTNVGSSYNRVFLINYCIIINSVLIILVCVHIHNWTVSNRRKTKWSTTAQHPQKHCLLCWDKIKQFKWKDLHEWTSNFTIYFSMLQSRVSE